MGTLFKLGLLVCLAWAAEKPVPSVKPHKKPSLAAAGWFAKGTEVKAAPKVKGQATMATQVPKARPRKVVRVRTPAEDAGEWTPSQQAVPPQGQKPPSRAAIALRTFQQKLTSRMPASMPAKPPAASLPVQSATLVPVAPVASAPLPPDNRAPAETAGHVTVALPTPKLSVAPAEPPESPVPAQSLPVQSPPVAPLPSPASVPAVTMGPVPTPTPTLVPISSPAPPPIATPAPKRKKKFSRSKPARDRRRANAHTPTPVVPSVATPSHLPPPPVKEAANEMLPMSVEAMPSDTSFANPDSKLTADPLTATGGLDMGSTEWADIEEPPAPKKKSPVKVEAVPPPMPAVVASVPEVKPTPERKPMSVYEPVCSCSCNTNSVTPAHQNGLDLFRDAECKQTIWDIRGLTPTTCAEMSGSGQCSTAYLKVGADCKAIDDGGTLSGCILKVKPIEYQAN